MSRYLVAVNDEDVVNDKTAEYDGEVVDSQPAGSNIVAVSKFEDEAKGAQYGLDLNATAFREEWAARRHAESRAVPS